MNTAYFDNQYNVVEVSPMVGAIMTTANSPKIFDETVSEPQPLKISTRGFVPWGEDNKRPNFILEKMGKDETLNSNLFFNVLAGYGAGFTFKTKDGSEVDDNIRKFFKRNANVKYWLEQFTDLKHFFWSVCVILISRDGTKITNIKHKEAKFCRFESCDPKTGIVEHVFFANWDDLDEKQIEKIPLLDEDDPIGDLMVRMGREESPTTGRKETMAKERKFAIVNRIPTPGYKYYSFPYFWSHFNSGWYDIKAMIALGKKAKMTNGMNLKYLVEFHPDYWDDMFENLQITDPVKQKEQKEATLENIRDFIGGIENSGKMWASGFYITPDGKEVSGIKITNLDTKKEGGDWNEDIDEAVAMQCYAMGVHPSIVGAVPGKSKNINGTEARELFTMKQAFERAPRDILSVPIDLIIEYNQWDNIEYDIPDLMLTTLDEGTDAKQATSKPKEDDTKNN